MALVVDTNVPVVANGKSSRASPTCVLACVRALKEARDSLVVIDDRLRIINEYRANLRLAGQPGPGDDFLKWVFDNQAVPARCERVMLTQRSGDPDDFIEFPNDKRLTHFDRSDRKFAAVALASQNDPEVLNAVDRDWWDHQEVLAEHGLRIRFVCGNVFGGRRPH